MTYAILATIYAVGFIVTISYIDVTTAGKFIAAIFWPVIIPIFWITVGIVALVDYFKSGKNK